MTAADLHAFDNPSGDHDGTLPAAAPVVPRLVATDLDGTLLDRDRAITPRTVAALRACAAAGIEVVFVTARPPRTVTPLVDAVGVSATAICSNGAIVLDCATGQATVVHEFAFADGRRLVEQLRPVLPDAGFALESGQESWHEAAFRLGTVSGHTARLAADLDEVWERIGRVVKILVRSPTLTADEMAAAALAAVTVPAEISHSGGQGLLEIAPPGATKSAALAALCAARGVAAAQVAAFGDMPNDLPMLRWAGLSYAVANAHPTVLAAASRVTAAHDEDGVALALEELLAAAG
ncbi:MAG TPA: HAD-IIB family hydrolase [Actinocrinis sp.]|nr:HAD-IIB family hydrolase [Actinocrinis sp.]